MTVFTRDLTLSLLPLTPQPGKEIMDISTVSRGLRNIWPCAYEKIVGIVEGLKEDNSNLPPRITPSQSVPGLSFHFWCAGPAHDSSLARMLLSPDHGDWSIC